MNRFITGDGHKFPSLLLACDHANRVHAKTGVIISVEAIPPSKPLEN